MAHRGVLFLQIADDISADIDIILNVNLLR